MFFLANKFHLCHIIEGLWSTSDAVQDLTRQYERDMSPVPDSKPEQKDKKTKKIQRSENEDSQKILYASGLKVERVLNMVNNSTTWGKWKLYFTTLSFQHIYTNTFGLTNGLLN